MSRSASFVVTAFGDDVGASQRKIFAEKVGKFPREIVNVALVDMCESEFVNDGKKETVISVIQPTFRTFLVPTIRRPTLLTTTSLLTPFAAVALTSVA